MLIIKPKKGVELLIVEVPEDAIKFKVDNEYGVLIYWAHNKFGDHVDILNGNYSFISTTKNITEEQAAELVKRWYYNHSNDFDFYHYVNGYYTEKSSIISLLSAIRSAGGDPGNKVYAILKNNKS